MFLHLQLAFNIMPHTFSLPDELELFREHLLQQQPQLGGSSEGGVGPVQDSSVIGSSSSSGAGAPSAEDSAAEDLWILKTAQHLGKGLKLMTAKEVGKEAGRRR